jgi:ABC-type multidrug transport system ATPase subunit
LKEQAKTRVGDIFRKGLSGGQKRRLSIALEIVAKPNILALDEPTSGLDSASAFHIVKKLKSIAVMLNAVIIASLHQPSSEVWENLDRLLLLSKGKVMFEGYINACLPAFEFAGEKCPEHYNPADFLLNLVNSDFNASVDLEKYEKKFIEYRAQNADEPPNDDHMTEEERR